MSRQILIVSAHPDDMEIGMGGTVAKLVEEGAEITSLIVTDGGRASNPFGWTEQRMAEVRRAEALRAAEVLGVKDVIFCDQPDASDEVDVKAVRRKLVELLTRLKPTEIYTLHEELDRHPAHRQAGSLVRDSVGESGFTPSGGIWAYEVWGPFATWDRIEYIDAYVEKKTTGHRGASKSGDCDPVRGGNARVESLARRVRRSHGRCPCRHLRRSVPPRGLVGSYWLVLTSRGAS